MFKNVVFDFDSTLVSVEGLDEIAKKQGKLAQIEQITTAGMNGSLPFSESLQTRFNLLAPTLEDVNYLIDIYARSLVSGAAEVISQLQKNGTNIYISTGGIKAAILPVAKNLGIKQENVFAVCTTLDMFGNLKLKETCLMTKDFGKTEVIKNLKKSGPTVMIGDGMTDFYAGEHADLFIGFGGVVKRNALKVKSKIYFEDPNLENIAKYLIQDTIY